MAQEPGCLLRRWLWRLWPETQPAGISPAALIRRTSTVTGLFRYDTLARTIARARTRRQRKRVPGTEFLTIDDLHLAERRLLVTGGG